MTIRNKRSDEKKQKELAEQQQQEKEQSKGAGKKEKAVSSTAIEPRNGKVTTLIIKTLNVSWRVLLPRRKTVKTTTGNYIQISGGGMKPIRIWSRDWM
jgi:hypothetical protein